MAELLDYEELGYKFKNGWTLKPEYHLKGKWVLRDNHNKFIDADHLRVDVAKRHGLHSEMYDEHGMSRNPLVAD